MEGKHAVTNKEGRRACVCIVDDDESVREALPDLLRQSGFEALVFASAEEFLAWDHPELADCLVLDVAMTGLTGPQLQVELRRRGLMTPVVFITAHSSEQVESWLLAQGAAACLFKPFSDTALLDAIHAALRES